MGRWFLPLFVTLVRMSLSLPSLTAVWRTADQKKRKNTNMQKGYIWRYSKIRISNHVNAFLYPLKIQKYKETQKCGCFSPPPSHSCLERSRTALTKTSPALSSSHLPASSVVIVGISEICSTSPNILEWNLYRFTKNFLVIRRSDVQFDWNYGQVSGQSVFAISTAFNRYPWVCSAGSHYWKYVGMDILPNLPQVVKWVGEAGAHPSHPIICPPTNPSLWHLPILVSPLHFCLFLFNSFSDWIVPCACLDLTSPMSIALFHLKKNIWALLPWLSTDQKCFHMWATERKTQLFNWNRPSITKCSEPSRPLSRRQRDVLGWMR